MPILRHIFRYYNVKKRLLIKAQKLKSPTIFLVCKSMYLTLSKDYFKKLDKNIIM